jgi:hypothetical protein
MLFPRNHIQRDTAKSTARDEVETSAKSYQVLKRRMIKAESPYSPKPLSFEACESQETVQQIVCEGHNKIVIFSQGIKILV